MVILPKESQVVSEEEKDNYDTMAKGGERDNEGVWIDREEDRPDGLRYNGEGNKNRCINREHAEESFEVSNRNVSKVRSEIRNKIGQSTTQANPIDLSRTAHPQFRALNLRHELYVHSQSGAKRSKKCKSSTLAAAIQPIPKRDSIPQRWWQDRLATELNDDQRRLLEELTGTNGVIDGNLRGLVFPI